MRTYEVYLSECPNPVWTYQEFKQLAKRLQTLAHDTYLSQAKVVVYLDGIKQHIYRINFKRDTLGNRWASERIE